VTVRALSLPHVRVRARRGTSVGRGATPPADSTTRTAARRPRAGPRRGTYTVRARARAPVRVRGPRFGAWVYWVPGGGLPATSAAGMVAEVAQDRTALLRAQAALGPGRPLAPDPGPDPGLVLVHDLSLALVLVHDPARGPAPRHTPRIPGDALGLDPTAGAVEAIVGMISGTAGRARPIPRTHDGRRNLTSRPYICYALKMFTG
jgi:hypothetical protein